MMDVVPLFKALADESRIRILSAIGKEGLSVEEIAAAVKLSPATVSHHLARLREAGLVDATPQSYYTIYRFRQEPLFEALQRLATEPTGHAPPRDNGAYDEKVLNDYLDQGRLKTIPAQRKKRDVILRFLAQQFEPDRRYGEKEVNAIIGAYHEDFATLRRELIMSRLLARDQGQYWRTGPVDHQADR